MKRPPHLYKAVILQVFSKESTDGVDDSDDHNSDIGKDGQPHIGNT